MNEIMQRALVLERGLRAERQYNRQAREMASSGNKPTEGTRTMYPIQRSNSPVGHVSSPRKFKKVQGQWHSTRPNPSRECARLQANQDEHQPSTPRPKSPRNDNRNIRCWGCGKMGHFTNDPTCEHYGQPPLHPNGEKLYLMHHEGASTVEAETENESIRKNLKRKIIQTYHNLS